MTRRSLVPRRCCRDIARAVLLPAVVVLSMAGASTLAAPTAPPRASNAATAKTRPAAATAAQVLNGAIKNAKATNKNILIHFGGPG
jgi:hypothetical protein